MIGSLTNGTMSSSTGGGSTATNYPKTSSGHSSGPSVSSDSKKKKRKPVHTVKALSAKEIRNGLKIKKRDIVIARRIVNNIRHK